MVEGFSTFTEVLYGVNSLMTTETWHVEKDFSTYIMPNYVFSHYPQLSIFHITPNCMCLDGQVGFYG